MVEDIRMTNEQILKKAVEKAINSGYEFIVSMSEGKRLAWTLAQHKLYYKLIFSHDFAKAFWSTNNQLLHVENKNAWNYHLQQMVIEEEPLKYLEKFL